MTSFDHWLTFNKQTNKKKIIYESKAQKRPRRP